MLFESRIEQQRQAHEKAQENERLRKITEKEQKKIAEEERVRRLEEEVMNTFAWSQIEAASRNPELLSSLKSYFDLEKLNPVPATQESVENIDYSKYHNHFHKIPPLPFDQCLIVTNHFETYEQSRPLPMPHITIFLHLATIRQTDREGDDLLPKKIGLEIEIYYCEEETIITSENRTQTPANKAPDNPLKPGIKYVLRSSATFPLANKAAIRRDWRRPYHEPDYHLFESLDELLNFLAIEVARIEKGGLFYG